MPLYFWFFDGGVLALVFPPYFPKYWALEIPQIAWPLGNGCSSSNAGVNVGRCLMVIPQVVAISSGTVLLLDLW
jgi:hypothetical protein